MLNAECERDTFAANGELALRARCDPFVLFREALVENIPPSIASTSANTARVTK